jgi:valyl-tRNA synthetase
MALPRRYNPRTAEPRQQENWLKEGTYHFAAEEPQAIFAVDTPPATVSGKLHLGHVYSYSHADFMARFWRMNGRNVLYPMGYDDNGLATERLVENLLGIRAAEIGRRSFIEKCLEVSEEAEKEYEALWRRLGLSIDWRYTYRTIDEESRRLSQLSFIDLYNKGLVYRRKAPTIWCPECKTAIAQAELMDLERPSAYVTLEFQLEDGTPLPIATTRPELLPACTAIFVHPDDSRFHELPGRTAIVPLYGHSVPILADRAADPQKGTGVVMCCTFGDTTDVTWWFKHELELVEAIGHDGHMTQAAGKYAGLPVEEARSRIKHDLSNAGRLISQEPLEQSIRIHERCDAPVEYIVATQWFVRILDFKDDFLQAGAQISWHPEHMKARYDTWVENLNWDWCISRQRYFGVTFPVWYCDACGAVIVANEQELPIDPSERSPESPCDCGGTSFTPETDVMDTWATSSLTPQLVARWLNQSGFDGQTFEPVSLRPQAHEIIRTWAFYSIVKAHHHFRKLPWRDAAISGWALAPEGAAKISKSRGGGPVAPMEMIQQHSADAVRYWAASTGLGKDATISEEKIRAGSKLVTKLWNVGRFCQPFIEDYAPPETVPYLSPADRWLLSRLQKLVHEVTERFQAYDYAAAKNLIEIFFWNDLSDNYLEMAKKRLYDDSMDGREGARYTLYHALLTTIKLLAPFLPHVTETVFQGLFLDAGGSQSVHRSSWPAPRNELIDEAAEKTGLALVQIARAVRRHKSNTNIALSAPLPTLHLAVADPTLAEALRSAENDLGSITRANSLVVRPELDPDLVVILTEGAVQVAID